ncbi:MAG: ABC transporter substrate-binding protein [Oscillospiraceae bacterium]|nr:ABC transporter substrate-binding protein [Oscillospiraceae bacterium]
MKKLKNVVALLICLAMAIMLLAACGPATPAAPATPGAPTPAPAPAPGPGDTPGAGGVIGGEAPAPEDGVTFADYIEVIGDNSTLAVIDPFNPAGNQPMISWVFRMIYDTLIESAGEGEFIPSLATQWHTEDWQTFTFYLRDDVVFHNGDPFTAADVEATILASREGVGTRAHDQWRPVETINVIDSHTIELVLDAVNVEFLFNVSLPTTGIVNVSAIEADPEQGAWIGTGPFTVQGFDAYDHVELHRFDGYWGEAPITQRIYLRFIPEITTRAIMMQNGESHLSFGTGSEDVPLFQNTDDFEIFSLWFNVPQGISFNMTHPITGDRNFRMAVLHALDRADISMAAAGEWAVPADSDGTFWGLQTEFRNTDIPLIPFDLDRARAYLEASPYNGETIEIATAMITHVRAAEVIQQQLSRIGITTTINQMDAAALHAYMAFHNNQTEMTMFGSAAGLNAGSVRAIFYPGGGQNRAVYDNPVVTAMLDEALSIYDVGERRDLYFRLQEIVAEDAPLSTMFWRVNPVVAAAGVGGVILPADHFLIDMRAIHRIID